MREVKLPSGSVLKVSPAPFADAKALYQALLDEAKLLSFNRSTDVPQLMKDIVCYGFSSKKIEAALGECFKRCTYDYGKGDLKIDGDSFEDPKCRVDYPVVCMEVATENVLPFAKSLSVVFERLSRVLPEDQTLRP